MSRPFGVALLIAGVDENGPQLYQTDPSGTYVKYLATAIGSASEGAAIMLQEGYNKSMTLKEAEKLALQTLRQSMEERLHSLNVEVAVLPMTTKQFRIYNDAELKAAIAQLT